jgi:phosphoribosyl 1,2-cyclic phosphate phosphodiesterase
LLIESRILLDCGPTVPWRLAELDVPPAQVEALIFTHSHSDHADPTAVESLLVARRSECGPLPVYGNRATLDLLVPLGQALQLHEATPGRAIEVLGRPFVPVRANHIIDEEETLNWLIGGDGGWAWYGTDTGWPLSETREALRNHPLRAAVVEATFGTAGPQDHPDCLTHHLNWAEFLRLRQELLADGTLPAQAPYVATHLSQHYAPPHEHLAPSATPPVAVAYDGLRLAL